jgi:hypothetical protein
MPPPVTTVSPREKGLRSGGKMLFFGLLTLPFIFAVNSLYRRHNFDVFSLWYLWPFLIPASFSLIGVMRMLYAWLFQTPIPAASVAMPSAPITANRTATALPGANQPPVVRTEVPNTSSVNQPSSVTEQTTNLLGRH